MPFEHLQYVKVIGQSPITFVSTYLSGKVWRIDKENGIFHVFILGEQFTVIGLYDFNSVEISIRDVIGLFDRIIQGFFFQFIEREHVTTRKQ